MEKTFSVSVPAETRTLHPKKDGRAEVTYTVTNSKPHPARGRVQVVPNGDANEKWFEISGDTERNFGAEESQQFKVLVSIPPDTSEGTYDFRIDAINVANPQEDFAQGETVAIQCQAVSPPAKKPRPKWLFPLLGAVALVMAVAITLALIPWGGSELQGVQSTKFEQYPVWSFDIQTLDKFRALSLKRPIVPDDYFKLGDGALSGVLSGDLQTLLIRGGKDPDAIGEPVDFEHVWSSADTPMELPIVTIWRPIAPEGYVALGHIAQQGIEKPKPGETDVRCVRRDLVTSGKPSEIAIWKWDDVNNALDIYTIATVNDNEEIASGSFLAVNKDETVADLEVWTLKKSALQFEEIAIPDPPPIPAPEDVLAKCYDALDDEDWGTFFDCLSPSLQVHVGAASLLHIAFGRPAFQPQWRDTVYAVEVPIPETVSSPKGVMAVIRFRTEHRTRTVVQFVPIHEYRVNENAVQFLKKQGLGHIGEQTLLEAWSPDSSALNRWAEGVLKELSTRRKFFVAAMTMLKTELGRSYLYDEERSFLPLVCHPKDLDKGLERDADNLTDLTGQCWVSVWKFGAEQRAPRYVVMREINKQWLVDESKLGTKLPIFDPPSHPPAAPAVGGGAVQKPLEAAPPQPAPAPAAPAAPR